jgi:regulatory protein YycH of two-component signal transduction system YycFG
MLPTAHCCLNTWHLQPIQNNIQHNRRYTFWQINASAITQKHRAAHQAQHAFHFLADQSSWLQQQQQHQAAHHQL